MPKRRGIGSCGSPADQLQTQKTLETLTFYLGEPLRIHNKSKKLKGFLSFSVIINTLLFLIMAYFKLLSTDQKSAVFIDFWGRYCLFIMVHWIHNLCKIYIQDTSFESFSFIDYYFQYPSGLSAMKPIKNILLLNGS